MHSRTPFGNPDGSRSDIQEVVESFVSFGQHHLGIPADDLSVRVVVGAKGSGKTVYLRRLHASAAQNGSVFAGRVQQDLPVTSNVVKFCQCFRRRDLTEKWMQLWNAAILRSLATHFLHARPLKGHLDEQLREELLDYPPEFVPRSRREVSVYSQVTDIITRHHTDRAFSQYFDDPTWSDLATTLGEILVGMPPVYFFVDSVDEEYANAPMFWLQCQKGLFFRTMRFLRDHDFGGRLHVVACVRDHVLASVLRGEHQNRYRGEPHIISLEWDYRAAEYFLQQKVARLPVAHRMRPSEGEATITDWLGLDEIENKGRGIHEPVVQYLLRHTRLLPRDIVIIGNRLCQEVQVARDAGRPFVDPKVIRRCVREAGKSFGNEQLAICANHIASSSMPADAARMEYDEIYTGDSEFARGLNENLVEVIQTIGKDRFGRDELELATLLATELFGQGSDALSVLWQNRLLGYVESSPDGRVETFFSERSADHFNLPRDRAEYCFHSSLIDRVGIRPVGDPVGCPPAPRARRAVDPGGDDVPESLGSYPVLGVLGRGGMGVVYLAEDPSLKRRIAIKVLPEHIESDPVGLARFRREAQILAALNHQNIATIYSMERGSGARFLTMEFVDGETLHHLCRGGALPLAECLEIAEQIARALQAAHGMGVIHRDLKPANVARTRDRQVKVLDFGLAKAMTDGAELQVTGDHGTSCGVVLGSPGYMSPEQIRGEVIDARTDLWGFGCTIFECLTGKAAFRGNSPMQRITASLETEPAWAALPKRTPRRVLKVLRQCLQKHPDHRPTSAGAILDVLG